MEDRKIKKLLFERSEDALKLLSLKYSRLYRGILRETLSNESDIEECANDVLLAVWNSIPPNDPESLSAYVCKIARRVGINRYKYNTRDKRSTAYTVMLSELEDCIPDTTFGDEYESGERAEKIRGVLSDFLKSLDAQTRVLFVRRYVYFESVSSLSERFGISENSISVKLFRTRKKLQKLLEKEGIYV